MFFETSVKERFVVKPCRVSDVRDGIRRLQNKVFCIIKSLLKEIFGKRRADIFLEHIADVLFGEGNVLRKSIYRIPIKIRRFCIIDNLPDPIGNRLVVCLRGVV